MSKVRTSWTDPHTEPANLYEKMIAINSAVDKWKDGVIRNSKTLNDIADYADNFRNIIGLGFPKIYETYKATDKAFKAGKNVKELLNKELVGDPKGNDKWNNPNYIFWEATKGNIPVIGKYLTLTESMSVLHHNLGQIADDLYRKQLNPLLAEELILEQKVMNSDQEYSIKKLKTMEMRRDFWKKELETFKMNESNKYYEEDKLKLQQLENDILLFKQQSNKNNIGFQFLDRPLKPEEKLYDKLQTIRDSFLMSGKTQADYDNYKKGIIDSTAKIKENQPEMFHVKTIFYENLDKDFYEMERDQSSARRALSMLISDYNKGAGSITKENFIHKLKGIISTGKLSSDPEVQDTGDAAERQIFFVEQAEKDKAKKKEHAAEIEANRKARENYNALKAASDLAIKEKSLEDESLQKHLDLNDLKAQADKDVINYRIKDEKAKADLLLDIERQRLEAAAVLEYEYAQKHSALYAGMQSGFGTMWNEFIVGSRRAKNSWDAVWLSMRNSALNKIGSEASDYLMQTIFKGSAGTGGTDKKDGNLLDTILSYAMYAIPFLADGAIVHKPTLAMIGEAGPEAVVPLDQMNNTKVIYVQPVIKGNFGVNMHKLQLMLDQNKQMMEELY